MQIRDLVQLQGMAGSAEKIQAIFKIVTHHIGTSSPANLGSAL